MTPTSERDPRPHLGEWTTQACVAWARTQGATAGAAQAFGRALVGRFAGRAPSTRVSRVLWEQAERTFADGVPDVRATVDVDGTIRYVARFDDGAVVEAVAISHPGRMTVCLSTQVGCARACVFCETGRRGLARQLAAHEIVGQFVAVRADLATRALAAPSNVVFMGMGEPLDNLDAVLVAIDVLTDDNGFAMAQRRITVSTVGIVPKMFEFHRRARCRLAVSLHAANDRERRLLVPSARTWDLAALKGAIAAARSSVLLQWTLIAGVNDTDRHADEIVTFCEGLDVRMNLLPLNAGPEPEWRAPSPARVRAFQKRLRDAGLRTLVRMPHGQGVGGACGQLVGAR